MTLCIIVGKMFYGTIPDLGNDLSGYNLYCEDLVGFYHGISNNNCWPFNVMNTKRYIGYATLFDPTFLNDNFNQRYAIFVGSDTLICHSNHLIIEPRTLEKELRALRRHIPDAQIITFLKEYP